MKVIKTAIKIYIFVPNAFSPNNDGLNDDLQITLKNAHLKSFELYNRWGNKIFETTDINNTWQGYSEGTKCDLATYYYILRYLVNGQELMQKGDVLLVR